MRNSLLVILKISNGEYIYLFRAHEVKIRFFLIEEYHRYMQ